MCVHRAKLYSMTSSHSARQWVHSLASLSCQTARRELLLYVLDGWKKCFADTVMSWLETEWRPFSRCHKCHWTGPFVKGTRCPQCHESHVLSSTMYPMQRCHYCDWIGNPAVSQECLDCSEAGALSLVLMRKQPTG